MSPLPRRCSAPRLSEVFAADKTLLDARYLHRHLLGERAIAGIRYNLFVGQTPPDRRIQQIDLDQMPLWLPRSGTSSGGSRTFPDDRVARIDQIITARSANENIWGTHARGHSVRRSMRVDGVHPAEATAGLSPDLRPPARRNSSDRTCPVHRTDIDDPADCRILTPLKRRQAAIGMPRCPLVMF